MPNFEEARLTIKDIRENPELHDQKYWGRRIFDTSDLRVEKGGVVGAVPLCGTKMCAAGFTVVRHGYQMEFRTSPYAGGRHLEVTAETCIAPDGERRSIEDAARRILGLDWAEATAFFHAANTVEDLEDMVDGWEAEEDANAEPDTATVPGVQTGAGSLTQV